jgi:hypothetical protein
MRVVEDIVVNVEGKAIKFGIKRSLPTQYKNAVGLRFVAPVTFEQALLDGASVAHKIVQHDNGVTIYIGDKQCCVRHGVHTYTITYTADRHIGFFKNHDQLYWNVTGIDNPFEVERATVRLRVPSTTLRGAKVPWNAIHIEAYTGSVGSQGHNYRAYVGSDGVAYCTLTQGLRPYEVLTIAADWPKGLVREYSRFWIYTQSNVHIIVLLVALLVIFGWYIWSYCTSRKKIKRGVAIPLFYPPDNADPGALRYVEKMGYDGVCLAANIVHMAVRGLLVIEYVTGGFFAQDYYVLKRRRDSTVKTTALEGALMQALFADTDTCSLLPAYKERFEQAKTIVAHTYELKYAVDYFKSNSECISVAVIMSLAAGLLAIVITPDFYKDILGILLILLHGVTHIVMANVLHGYSQVGQKFKEEIEGFKMFLATTEAERMNIIGTMPTQTPELYEAYLPYAIALNVEEQWSRKFVPVFKNLELSGQSYQPSWFNPGHPFMLHDLYFLSTGFGSSFEQALTSTLGTIASSETPPGSSSGSGGQGSSGCGGGGGGIGGW